MFRLLVIAMTFWLPAIPAHGAALAVALAVDVSASVTPNSYILQHEGIARAFADPRLLQAIGGAAGAIEVLVLEWSDPDKIKVTVDWTAVTDQRSARAFAAAVRATGRSSRGLTAIGPALAAAAAQFDHLPASASRRVIDISGDGMADFGAAPAAVRDRIVAEGITINGLRDPDRGAVARSLLSPQCDRRPRSLCHRGAGFRQLRRGDAAKTRAGGRGR